MKQWKYQIRAGIQNYLDPSGSYCRMNCARVLSTSLLSFPPNSLLGQDHDLLRIITPAKGVATQLKGVLAKVRTPVQILAVLAY